MTELIFNINLKEYDFISLVKSVYSVEEFNLEELHKHLPSNEILQEVNFENDNETWFHKKFYNKLNSGWPGFEQTYEKFIVEVIKPLFKVNKLIYQRRPTFRVQIPNNKSVGEYHRDYTYNHQLGEINFVMPLTDMVETTAIWAESLPGLNDFHPINVKKGQMIAFNGNLCLHGNKVNTTTNTRVSFDFRIISEDFYDPDFAKKSTGKGILMTIGNYYDCK